MRPEIPSYCWFGCSEQDGFCQEKKRSSRDVSLESLQVFLLQYCHMMLDDITEC